jgi:hypothetical protein
MNGWGGIDRVVDETPQWQKKTANNTKITYFSQ